MIEIEYAKDTSKWMKPWQHEYRYGLFLIMPPKEIADVVNVLRETYDPESAKSCEAHISLSRPLQSSLTQEGLDDIASVLQGVEPFQMRYGPLVTYPPHRGVAFDIAPREEFENLRDRLHTASPFEGFSFNRDSIPPHMTIADSNLTWEQSEELKNKLKDQVSSGEFLCDGLEYIVPNEDFVFERKLRVSFGAAR